MSNDEAVKSTVAKAEKPAGPVFQTFQTKTPLLGGLCVIVDLGNGNYELLNVDSAQADALGSMETGRLIRTDETGGRLKALEGVERAWKSAELKIGQALGSASTWYLASGR